ncbi:MAG TPA: tetratricopeptide repeat protein [Syntrophorhabdaceae bacterium]|nr:tetratricopeptide repeat protein [Syntrophorhabdaceae bacterium]
MDAVTYPDTRVSTFVTETVVPVRVPADAEPLATDFTLRWTPTLIILDREGKEHARTVGFIAPEEFIPTILAGMARAYIDLKQFDPAIKHLETIINSYPQSFAAPEAIFYRAVCGYKTAHDVSGLKRAYERLTKEHPKSEWTSRALPYRLLP